MNTSVGDAVWTLLELVQKAQDWPCPCGASGMVYSPRRWSIEGLASSHGLSCECGGAGQLLKPRSQWEELVLGTRSIRKGQRSRSGVPGGL